MRFEKVDPNKVTNHAKRYHQTKILAVLNEFIKAEIPMALIIPEEGEYVNSASIQASVNRSIKRFHLDHVQAKCINKKVYLVNTLLWK